MPQERLLPALRNHIIRNQEELDYINRRWFQGYPRRIGQSVNFAEIHLRQFNRDMHYGITYDPSRIIPLPLPG